MLAAWLAGSMGLHLALAALVTHLFYLPVDLPRAGVLTHVVELEALENPSPAPPPPRAHVPPPDSPELAARLGDPRAAPGERAADSLSLPPQPPAPWPVRGSRDPGPRPSPGRTWRSSTSCPSTTRPAGLPTASAPAPCPSPRITSAPPPTRPPRPTWSAASGARPGAPVGAPASDGAGRA